MLFRVDEISVYDFLACCFMIDPQAGPGSFAARVETVLVCSSHSIIFLFWKEKAS